MTRNADMLTDQDRLTLLSYLLRTVTVSNGSPFTLFDRLAAMGLEPDRLLETAQPMSAPPLSLAQYGRLTRWPLP